MTRLIQGQSHTIAMGNTMKGEMIPRVAGEGGKKGQSRRSPHESLPDRQAAEDHPKVSSRGCRGTESEGTRKAYSYRHEERYRVP